MVRLMASAGLRHWSKEAGHALLILIFSILASIFLGEFTFLKGWESVYRGLFRFFRFTFSLCLPLYFLLPIYGKLGFVFKRKDGTLIKIQEKEDLEIRPTKHWLSRPFQGIGIGLLFATKLLGVLLIVSGSTATASILLPQGQFQPERLFVVAGITVFLSLFLSTVWTLDDLGIRYFNERDYEIKMVGKYVGTLMPVLFGFYGIFSLFGDYPRTEALTYLFQIVVILYPPFAVFSILHSRFIQRRAESLSKTLFTGKAGWLKTKNGTLHNSK